jgi:hypothetical protein
MSVPTAASVTHTTPLWPCAGLHFAQPVIDYTEINSLAETLEESQKKVMIHLSKCVKLRDQEVYDHSGVVNPQDVDDLIETAEQLREEVLSWLKANHPDLYPTGYA